ncbi:hypothetical protein ACQEV2_43320 [Streptomyces sp. CA-251387]|uniref:hypothetical protein n=1 Tax=Streptomyces sp. CA-251387 TaxID=3240064 RepID=UPI003D8F353B
MGLPHDLAPSALSHDTATRATFLDSEVWHTPLSTSEVPPPHPTVDDKNHSAGSHLATALDRGRPGAGEAYRFGPGVPRVSASIPDHAAAIWRGATHPCKQPRLEASGRRRRRQLSGWLLPPLILLAALALLAWQRHGGPIAVTAVNVHTSPRDPACDSTATITGTLQTNGKPGTVTYRWKRSDGTISRTLQQRVAPNARQTNVVLRWTFNGHGTLQATATLEVLSPDPQAASTTFTYTCR